MRKLLKKLFDLMEGIASGTKDIKDIPPVDEFLLRISAAAAVCTDSKEDIRAVKRDMATIASDIARVCDQVDKKNWRNVAYALEHGEGFGKVSRY